MHLKYWYSPPPHPLFLAPLSSPQYYLSCHTAISDWYGQNILQTVCARTLLAIHVLHAKTVSTAHGRVWWAEFGGLGWRAAWGLSGGVAEPSSDHHRPKHGILLYSTNTD